jgi:hypothetical protein
VSDDDSSRTQSEDDAPEVEPPTREKDHQFRNDCAYQIPEA